MQIVVFVLILSMLVLIHELGHYLVAKFFGMRVDEFGIGLPPRAKGLFTKWGTLFSLNWIPLGGFVKLYGEDPDDSVQANSPEAFFNKPIWQRALVLTAGVFMNFVLGIVLFGAVYSYLGIPTKTDKVLVMEVVSGSPADKVGLKPKDALHIACAKEAGCHYFLTTDDIILKRMTDKKGILVLNPIDFIKLIEKL